MSTLFEAQAAVVPSATQRRRHHREDLCFQAQLRVLDDDEAVEALGNLQRMSGPCEGSEPPRHGELYTLNLSAGGLGLCGDLRRLRGHHLAEGDLLQICLKPPRAGKPVHCLGNVTWVRHDHAAGIFRAGVSFVAVRLQDLQPYGWCELGD